MIKPVTLAPTPAPKPAAVAPTPAPKPAVTIGAVSSAVKMPEVVNKRGSKSKYPFDDLNEVGQSFPVIGKTAASLASVVSGQNRKHKVAKVDAAGNTVYTKLKQTAPDGSVTEVDDKNKPEMVEEKKFFAVDTDPKTDPDKATARVFRKV